MGFGQEVRRQVSCPLGGLGPDFPPSLICFVNHFHLLTNLDREVVGTASRVGVDDGEEASVTVVEQALFLERLASIIFK